MKIEAIDAFYLRMPVVDDVGDGSQDSLLIRVQLGGFTGWGESEASPLTTLAALVAPMSHSACLPVREVVLGQTVVDPSDIDQLAERVHARCLDLLQWPHAWSGIEIALWDALGRSRGVPSWSFFSGQSYPRIAYASLLFGETPAETYERARSVAGFRAAKLGWGPFGRDLALDREHLRAAREGLGPDRQLMVDAGCAFGYDVEAARARIPDLLDVHAVWLEEPFHTGALSAYRELRDSGVATAGGEGASLPDHALHLMEFGEIRFVQIDAGRIGGISAARRVALAARERGCQFVNHTFTSNLCLAASLTPYADSPDDQYAEYPHAPSPLARAIGGDSLRPDSDGHMRLADLPGLGVVPDLNGLKPYIQEVSLRWNGALLYETPNA